MSDSISGQFVLGQRWISNTEAELGLGIVSDTDHRFVNITFPAAGEQRVYAKNNAPLTRVQYRIGEQVQNIEGETLRIESVEEEHGYLTYFGRGADDGDLSWGEIELDCFVQFSKPQDRLFAGQIDKIRDFRLRHSTLLQQQRLAQMNATGLIGPRVQLLHHQLYIAHEVGGRFAPRVLLADEVGLGKTIEAGLIIHQQLVKGLSQRVLIAVPENLTHQWLVEMLRRFNLSFTLLDEARCQALEQIDEFEESGDSEDIPGNGDNPFESAQLILCSLPLLTENGERLQQALACDWDLLIVDEAHHLQWHENEQCPAYDCVEQLARIARGLLLLTATPEQLGLDSHFARLRLLDPDRYFDFDTFKQEQSQFQSVNHLVQRLLSSDDSASLLQDDASMQALEERLGATALDQLRDQDNEDCRDNLVNQLLDRHGTGRVLFRNTRSGVLGFPQRQLIPHELAPTTPDASFADTARVQWLTQWLKANRKEKVLIICSSADMAQDLETHLNLRCGVRSAVFFEGLSLLERDRAAAYFADAEDGAQVLVCSEIGSEGRNFQFAHQLVMFDLPQNPDLIEQRIGRLDRIGQTQTVQIHVPFESDSADARLLQFLHLGLNCFEQVCPAGQALFDEFCEQLLPLLDVDANQSLDALIERARSRTDHLLTELKNGRDRLLELNSCKTPVAEALVEELSQLDQSDALKDYMDNAFDIYGVDHERHSEDAFVAHPSDHMQTHHFPGLPDEGITATYHREQALSREDMHYLTWEHPMVAGVMDMVLNSERGNTAVCTMKLPPLKPGSLLIESLFQFSCPGPRSLQLQRFFSAGCVRLVADNNLKSLGEIISSEHYNKLGKTVKMATAKQLVQHARTDIDRIVTHLEDQAKTMQTGLVEDACQALSRHYDQELSRLRALAEINPNIRADEIEHLETQKQAGLEYLQSAKLRLDAIRVAVITD